MMGEGSRRETVRSPLPLMQNGLHLTAYCVCEAPEGGKP